MSELWRALRPGGILIPNSGHGGLGYVIKAAVLSAFIRKQGGLYWMSRLVPAIEKGFIMGSRIPEVPSLGGRGRCRRRPGLIAFVIIETSHR